MDPADTRSGHRSLRKGRVSLPGHVYHVTTATHDREPLFRDFQSARIAIRWINHRHEGANHELLAWVLMPDHLHALIHLGERDTLSGLVNRLKSSSARAVKEHLRRTDPVWQRSYHDHALRREEDLRTVARYIIANPIRAGLTRRASDYPHWDAVWL